SGGACVTDMRRYARAGVLGSMQEVFDIGREAGCAVHISHFNSRADLALPALDEARAAGVDVTYDLYCYLAGSTILAMQTLPPWVQEGGPDATLARLRDTAVRQRLAEWFQSPKVPLETVRLSYVGASQYRRMEGSTLAEAAGGASLGDLVCELLLDSELAVGCVVPHRQRGEEDVRALMK